MKKCTICGNTLADSEYRCQNCGALACSICGQMYPAGNIMCITDTVLLSGVVLQGPYEADRYEIVELVHRGGMSNIYRARLLRFGGWPCAIKEMLPPVVGRGERGKGPTTSRQEEMRRSFEEARELFAREAAILRGLNHPNIPKVYDFFEQFGKYYLVMEFIEGPSLHDIANQSRAPLSAEQVIQWGIQICEILSYLHQQKPLPIVHRDIKPDNLILARDEQGREKIVLVDFGIARAHKGRKTSDTIRAVTIAFAAPEQKGELRVESSPQTDIYELGTTLYFLLTNCGTGSVRYLAITEHGVMGLPHPNVPLPLEQVIRKATAWLPQERFESAQEMRASLQAALGVRIPSAEQPTVMLSELYIQGLEFFNRKQWANALEALERVWAMDPNYRDTARLIATARAKKAKSEKDKKSTGRKQRPKWSITLIVLLGSSLIGGIILCIVLGVASLFQKPTPADIVRPLTAAPTSSLTPTSTRAPTFTPTATPAITILFEDDFSDPASGWAESSDADSEREYREGQYHIKVKTTQLAQWASPKKDFSDFVVEVETTKVDGPDDNDYGIVFRIQDNDNLYSFDIASDGYYLVRKLQDGEWTTLVKWTETPHINQGEATNHLKVICHESRLVFYVNNHYLTAITDTSFERGDVGLFAGTINEPGTHIAFDNFKIYPLTPEMALVLTATPTPSNVELARAHLAKGDDLFLQSRWEEAIVEYTKAIELESDSALAYNKRGVAYWAIKDYDRAIADHTRAIELAPMNAAAYYDRGDDYYAKDEYDKAIADYTKAIELDPSDADYYTKRGNAYHAKENYDLAIADYIEAIRLEPNEPILYFNRGNSYLFNEDADSALSDYNKALALGIEDVEIYLLRGLAYESLGRNDEAIADYEKFISLSTDPELTETARERLSRLKQ